MATKKNFRQQCCEELMYWRGRLGYPDLTPQTTIAAHPQRPAHPEVDPVAKKQFDVLVETLLSRASSVPHLDRIIKLLQSKHANCPTPPEIHAAADAVDAIAEAERADWGNARKPCRLGLCDGSGFLVSAPGAGAKFCQCHGAYVPTKGDAHASAR